MRPSKPKPLNLWAGLVGIALLVSTGQAIGEEPSPAAVQEIFKRAGKMEPKGGLPKAISPQMAEAARKDYNAFNSLAVQEKLKASQEKIREKVLQPFWTKDALQHSAGPRGEAALPGTERVFLLVSSSMPIGTLRAYAQDLDRLRDPNFIIVLRGVVGGMTYFRPTLDCLEKILFRETGCRLDEAKTCNAFKAQVVIDPLIYRMLGVREVPAVADANTWEYQRSVESQKVIYKSCGYSDICPAGEGETILQDCECLNEFAFAASYMQVLDEASRDMICAP